MKRIADSFFGRQRLTGNGNFFVLNIKFVYGFQKSFLA